MARRFMGNWVHKVDAKGRLSIPAQFRRVIEAGDPDWVEGLNPSFAIIHNRTSRRCLECFTIRVMDEIGDMIANDDVFNEEREYLEFVMNAQADVVQLDENGRVVLSQKLREAIDLGAEATVAGMGEKFHIWRPEAFEAFGSRMRERPTGGDAPDPFRRLNKLRLQPGSAA